MARPWYPFPMQSPSARPDQERSRPRRLLSAAVAALLGVAIVCAPAAAQSPMIQGWLAANTACKGGAGDDPKTKKACTRRDDLGAKLKRRGCEYQEDGDWWRCPH